MEKEKFAVIETGGKQYLVREGDTIKIEKLKKPDNGEFLNFEKTLLYVDHDEIKIGKPYLTGLEIKAEWLKEAKAKKIKILRYHSKTRRRRRKGHRQTYTQIKIKEIKNG